MATASQRTKSPLVAGVTGRVAGQDAAAMPCSSCATTRQGPIAIHAIIPPPASSSAQAGLLLPTSPHCATSYIKSPSPSREGGDRPAIAPDPSSSPSSNDTLNPLHSKMIFSDLYRSPRSPLSKLRHSHPQPVTDASTPDYNADLVSKDKARQKEAVKRYLAERVRNDWDFPWPAVTDAPAAIASEQPGTRTTLAATIAALQQPKQELEGFLEVATANTSDVSTASDDEDAILESGDEADSDVESVYSSVSEDPEHYRPRAEWTSDMSDDEDEPHVSSSPFRFDSPDAVGTAVIASSIARKTQQRRDLRKEMSWNEGLACFEARRNAWTGAKTVRVKPKPATPGSTTSSRRHHFWRTLSHSTAHPNTHAFAPSSPASTGAGSLSPVTTINSHYSGQSHPGDLSTVPTSTDGDSNAAASLSHKSSRDSTTNNNPALYPVETLLPIAPPILPPANPMRASISPSIYISIYEKVVVNSMQPSCPINLADMMRACVAGWKRDGEWPPRSAPPPAVIAVKKKKAAAASAPKSPTSPGGTTRRMSFGFLGKGDEKQHSDARRESSGAGEDGGAGKAIRRSLHKVLSLGHGRDD